MTEDDNETWLIDAGDVVITKKAETGMVSLTTFERLIYSLWVADYGMRNAGDLVTASDLHARFQEEGRDAAIALGLARTAAAFSSTTQELQDCYFEVFDDVCAEIRALRHYGDSALN